MNKATKHNYELAEIDYVADMKYKDIAQKYGTSLNTVKSWKVRYGWERAKSKNVHTKLKKMCTQNENKKRTQEAIADEVDQVIENTDLTDKQRLFCCLYIKCFNATKVYQKVYKCSYEVAAVNGPRMLGNARVKEEILRLK